MTTSEHEAFWSARYRDAGDDYLSGTAPNTFLASPAPLFKSGQRVLAVAEGSAHQGMSALVAAVIRKTA